MRKIKKPKLPKAVLEFFQATGAAGGNARAKNRSTEEIAEWGAKGGMARAAKYGAEQLRKWGKLGGRPKSAKRKQATKKRSK